MKDANYYLEESKNVAELKHFPYKSFSDFQASVFNESIVDIGVPMDLARNWVTRSNDSPSFWRNLYLILMMYVFCLPVFYLLYGIVKFDISAVLYILVSIFVAFTGSPFVRKIFKSHYYVIGFYLLIWLINGALPNIIFWFPILCQYIALNQIYKGSAGIVREVVTKNESVLCLFWKWWDLQICLKDGSVLTQRDCRINDKTTFYEDISEEWKEYCDLKSKKSDLDKPSDINSEKNDSKVKDKTNVVSLWEDYSNLSNSNDDLIQKAKLLAPYIAYLGINSREELLSVFTYGRKSKKKITKIINDKASDLGFKYTYFILHFTDRMAFQFLDNEQRNIFIDNLLDGVTTIIWDKANLDGDQRVVIRNIFFNGWNDFQTIYGKYKISAEKDESLKDTIFWEFGKEISIDIIGESSSIPILGLTTLLSNHVASLQLPELLREK